MGDFYRNYAAGDALLSLNRPSPAISPRPLSFFSSVKKCREQEVTHQQVEGYLRGLRAADGKKKASPKFWNNTLNDLKGFFAWSATADKMTNRPFTFENPAATSGGCSLR